jgi:4-hydroxybenzoate polyprenyltransferase
VRRLRYRDAESLCRQALRLDRRNSAAYEILGDIHRARGEQDEAIAMYSYALQLNRNNRALREKFDRLVGQQTGPTFANREADTRRARSRYSRKPQSPVEKKLAITLAVINGVGGALVACMLAAVAITEATLARGPVYLEWAPLLLIALSSSGWMCGFVLAVNRRIGRFFDELTGLEQGTGVKRGLPLGALTVVAAVISLYAGFLIYAGLGALRRFHSSSVLCAFGVSAAITVFFTMVAQSAGIYVLISGGGVVFLAFLVGWLVGDHFR